jgi:hypothetical protein
MSTLTNELASISKLADEYINQDAQGRFFGDKASVINQLLELKKIQAHNAVLAKLNDIESLIKQNVQ